jgi:hypothetical protein
MQFTVAMISQKKPTTTQQIIDYATQKAIKTLDANEDGEVSALEFVAPFAVGASGLGTFKPCECSGK